MFDQDLALALTMSPGAQLAGILDGLTPGEAGDRDLIAGLRGFDRIESWAAAGKAALAAELFARNRAEMGAQSGFAEEFTADEISAALRVTRQAGAAIVDFAQDLATLPATADALRRGRITARKARLIAQETAHLDQATALAVQDRVLPRAPEQTPPQLRAALVRAVAALAQPREIEQRHREARADRRVVLTPGADGMAEIWALMPAPEAQVLYLALTAMAIESKVADRDAARRAEAESSGEDSGEVPAEPDAEARALAELEAAADASVDSGANTEPANTEPARTLEQRRVDALGDLGELVLSRDDLPANGRAKPRIQVTIPACALTGCTSHPADLHGHGPIPHNMAAELAGDGVWSRVLTDPVSGTLLDLGRTTYVPTTALADHVRARDVTCRFPGCRQPARRADLDHTEPWVATANAPAGATADHNLGALCRHHHRLKTHGRWKLTQPSSGTFEWTSPTGHTYTVTPPDLTGGAQEPHRPTPPEPPPPREAPTEEPAPF